MVELRFENCVCRVSDQVAINVMGLRTVKCLLIPANIAVINPDDYFVSYADCVANKDRLEAVIDGDYFDD